MMVQTLDLGKLPLTFSPPWKLPTFPLSNL
jgi:hypothetical protein